jgi:protease IV
MHNQLPPGQVPPPLPPSQPPVFISNAPPRRGGGGWMLLSFILLVVIGVLMAGRAFRFFSHVSGRATGSESGRHFEEIVVENPAAGPKIAIVPVEGMISREFDPTGRNMVDVLEDQLKLAAKDEDVKAVILKIDSPGGEVMASDDISRAIVQFQDKYNKPVIASMQGLAASGGYYVAAPCRWIIANELTITGSIGVILSSFNYRGLMDKVGLQPVVFKSGKFKDMLRGSKRPEEIDPAEQEMIQQMVMETYQKFKSVVKTGREAAAAKNGAKGTKLAADWEDYADGRILTGKKARDLGFVDQLGNFQTAVDTAREIAAISGKARLIRYEEPFSLSRLFGLGANARAAKANTLKLDLGLELPKVEAGRMYFLSPSFAH